MANLSFHAIAPTGLGAQRFAAVGGATPASIVGWAALGGFLGYMWPSKKLGLSRVESAIIGAGLSVAVDLILL